MNKRGIALIICYMIIVALSLLAGSFLTRSVSERSVTSSYFNSTQAFWLAEAGVNKALSQLRTNPNNLSPMSATTLGPGQYSFGTITSNGNNRTVTAYGYIPLASSSTQRRVIQATMSISTGTLPANFFDYAIYSAGNVDIGSNCTVNGKVISGGTVTGSASQGTTSNDPTLQTGLSVLNFDNLQAISVAQGWYNPTTHVTTYPSSFWNVPPAGGNPGTPNVVFVDGDFTLVGGKQVAYGFIVVGGNTVYDAEIGGNAGINGCLYTRGDIWMHGGGGKVINLDGGIWAGGTVNMVGNEQINFSNPGDGVAYNNAIKNLGGLYPAGQVAMISWQETQ